MRPLPSQLTCHSQISAPIAVPGQRFYNNTLESFRLSNIDVEETAA